jgi:hypothetical protein
MAAEKDWRAQMRGLPLLIAATLTVAGCSVFGYEHHMAIGHVELYASDSIKVRVPYEVKGRGNVHDPFSYSKWEFMKADWIAIDSTQGVSTLNGKRLTPCPLGYNKWYGARMVKGTIEIRQAVIRIDLFVPKRYDRRGATTAWKPYEFNGEWALSQPHKSLLQLTTPSSESNCEPGTL